MGQLLGRKCLPESRPITLLLVVEEMYFKRSLEWQLLLLEINTFIQALKIPSVLIEILQPIQTPFFPVGVRQHDVCLAFVELVVAVEGDRSEVAEQA